MKVKRMMVCTWNFIFLTSRSLFPSWDGGERRGRVYVKCKKRMSSENDNGSYVFLMISLPTSKNTKRNENFQMWMLVFWEWGKISQTFKRRRRKGLWRMNSSKNSHKISNMKNENKYGEMITWKLFSIITCMLSCYQVVGIVRLPKSFILMLK